MTKAQQSYPTWVQVKFKGQVGSVALDQIRAVDKSRFIHKVGVIKEPARSNVLAVLQEMFCAVKAPAACWKRSNITSTTPFVLILLRLS